MSYQIIEPIFGIMKRQWNLEYTIVKGKENVETEYRIAAIAYNLLRLQTLKGKKWIQKRLKKLYKYLFYDSKVSEALQYRKDNVLQLGFQYSHTLKYAS